MKKLPCTCAFPSSAEFVVANYEARNNWEGLCSFSITVALTGILSSKAWGHALWWYCPIVKIERKFRLVNSTHNLLA